MQSGQIYKVARIDSLQVPPKYYLQEEDGTASGWSYGNQLKKAPDPKSHVYPFTIVDERVRRGKQEVLLKYLFYPKK